MSFNDRTMKTAVYLKRDAHDQLLPSEGVCRQLGIISYHPWMGGRKPVDQKKEARVPRITVRLISSLRLPSCTGTVIPVQVESYKEIPQGVVLFQENPWMLEHTGVVIPSGILQPDSKGIAYVKVENHSGYTECLEESTEIGTASQANIVEYHDMLSQTQPTPEDAAVNCIRTEEENDARKRKLRESLGIERSDLPLAHRDQLLDMVTNFHDVFSLAEEERGETDWVQFDIDTGDAQPRKVPLRRMPLSVRKEVAWQVSKMQETGVIVPSKSPWSSPVVLVRKKDGTHRFCVDYRNLNAVTKPDSYPLPRMDDLLKQLGRCKFFSTLDLAAGYWQIKMHPESREKTAFATAQGLFEFQVMPFGLTNAPAVFQRLMQRVLMGVNPPQGPDFVSVYIDDILIFSESIEDHLQHLQLVLERLVEAKLKLKPSKCRFIRNQVEYLGHVITPEGLKTSPKLLEAVKKFPVPRNLREVRQYLGLCSYYRRFISQFAAVARPLHLLTRKGADFRWCTECEQAFETLKRRLTEAPVLAYPQARKPFILETDASGGGLGAVLSQAQADTRVHPIGYASRSLSKAESNYTITELETLAVVWALSHFRSYIYGNDVTVYTDHSAVRAVLETPNPSGKHARWWSKVYESGVKTIKIVYKSGKSNTNADALSRAPVGLAQHTVDDEIQVAAIQSRDIVDVLESEPWYSSDSDFAREQKQDAGIQEIVAFLEHNKLPMDDHKARKLALQSSLFSMVDGILYFVDSKKGSNRRVVLPKHLQQKVMEEAHGGTFGGHFCGPRLYAMLARHWWWENMYSSVLLFCKACAECAIATGGSHPGRPPLSPIPVQRPFQIMGVDLMELPMTTRGNKYVLVFQDLFTKWPMVYPLPDQKTEHIVKILVEEIVPFFGVPEALLSDRGTNLLSNLMLDVCKLLGIQKLNTTAYHPQCDGMVERFNRTLKSMLRKHAAKLGNQWDRYLPGVLWAYRNTPHDSTLEKPSFLLFGMDCRSPTEAALLPPQELTPTSVRDYREELMLSLSSARKLAGEAVKRAQKKYKRNYDRHSHETSYDVGEWILIRFPQEEKGRNRKLSRPWHE